VAIVGKIIDVVKETVTTNLIIDDTTGRIVVKIYADGDAIEEERLSELRPGIIVRAFGHLNGSENDRYITAFGARPVTDFNEVTYHLTQIIFQHAHLTKGAPELAGAGGPAGGAAYGGAPAGAANAAPMADFANGNLNAIQAEVKNIFNAPDAMNNESGLTVIEVLNRTGGRFNHAMVREAITFLVDDGQLYSTIDDEHWKACA
jgi:replication factor A2